MVATGIAYSSSLYSLSVNQIHLFVGHKFFYTVVLILSDCDPKWFTLYEQTSERASTHLPSLPLSITLDVVNGNMSVRLISCRNQVTIVPTQSQYDSPHHGDEDEEEQYPSCPPLEPEQHYFTAT